jgi:hypothetical protein
VDRLRTRHGVNYHTAVVVTHRKTPRQFRHLYKHRRQQSILLRRLLPLCCEGAHPRRESLLDSPADLDALDGVLHTTGPVHGETSPDNPDDTQHRIPPG